MSKQKKEKQSPVLGRLLEYAGGHKWLSVLGCGLSGVSAAVGIFPFVFVWYAARGILTPGGGVSAGLARYGWYALAAALLSAAIYFAGLMCTHLAAFRVATNMRKAAVAHLIDLPLGYFNANLTGRAAQADRRQRGADRNAPCPHYPRRGGRDRNADTGGGAALRL